MDQSVRENLNTADRNLAIATDLLRLQPEGLDGPAYEWFVVVCFFAADRSINAYLIYQTDDCPASHFDRFRQMRNQPTLDARIDNYTEIRS